MGREFSEDYELWGGDIRTPLNANGTVAGLRNAIIKMFGAAVVNPRLLPPRYGIEELEHLKMPPSYDKRLIQLEVMGVAPNVDVRNSYAGLEFHNTGAASIPIGTHLCKIDYPIAFGTVVDRGGDNIEGVGLKKLVNNTTPRIANSIAFPPGLVLGVTFDGTENGYEYTSANGNSKHSYDSS